MWKILITKNEGLCFWKVLSISVVRFLTWFIKKVQEGTLHDTVYFKMWYEIICSLSENTKQRCLLFFNHLCKDFKILPISFSGTCFANAISEGDLFLLIANILIKSCSCRINILLSLTLSMLIIEATTIAPF